MAEKEEEEKPKSLKVGVNTKPTRSKKNSPSDDDSSEEESSAQLAKEVPTKKKGSNSYNAKALVKLAFKPSVVTMTKAESPKAVIKTTSTMKDSSSSNDRSKNKSVKLKTETVEKNEGCDITVKHSSKTITNELSSRKRNTSDKEVTREKTMPKSVQPKEANSSQTNTTDTGKLSNTVKPL